MKLANSARLLIASLALTAGIGGAAAASAGTGGGHTPIVVCHWVPAHGGSYIVITVDDDGASGNKNLQGHMGHPNDIMGNADGTCGPQDLD
jgi:hypothetical protein